MGTGVTQRNRVLRQNRQLSSYRSTKKPGFWLRVIGHGYRSDPKKPGFEAKSSIEQLQIYQETRFLAAGNCNNK
ncbi:MAG TPA: hypothetical protein DCY88_25880 [Cyanobacteria bacterium UBA11372]|nr:hypothetical protein [Cyanobacteria bacterium UBA11372]